MQITILYGGGKPIQSLTMNSRTAGGHWRWDKEVLQKGLALWWSSRIELLECGNVGLVEKVQQFGNKLEHYYNTLKENKRALPRRKKRRTWAIGRQQQASTTEGTRQMQSQRGIRGHEAGGNRGRRLEGEMRGAGRLRFVQGFWALFSCISLVVYQESLKMLLL